MKRIVFLLIVLSSVSCTKEKDLNSLTGQWTLTEIDSGTTSSLLLSRTELSVEFKENDSLIILGPEPNYTFLQDFNRYEVLANDRIRFFNTTTQEELFAVFHVGKTLSLSYEVRCPYEEKFIRRE